MSDKISIYPLDNTIQTYDWGTTDAFTSLFGWENLKNEPRAELWMGTHPNGPSKLKSRTNTLHELIQGLPSDSLGRAVDTKKELRFLFKVLSAAQALSIQVHPTIVQATIGFELEEQMGIDRSAKNRNYKDPNHKPELICALTPFVAMCGFREVSQIGSILSNLSLPWLNEWMNSWTKPEPSIKSLKKAYINLISLDKATQLSQSDSLKKAIYSYIGGTVSKAELDAYSKQSVLSPFMECLLLASYYPGDIAIISPLLMQLEYLSPGEALFLGAGIPHAYLRGTGLEIMAASDNVLRGGLTTKHIDYQELAKVMSEEYLTPMRIQPKVINQDTYSYDAPVDDFLLTIISLNDSTPTELLLTNASIILSIDSTITLSHKNQSVSLNAGESAFLLADKDAYHIFGEGKAAIASSN